jgi:hypothetical protein
MAPLATFQDLCLDAVDPALASSFWAPALDLHVERREEAHWMLTGPTPQHTLWINRVPEPRTVKQRVHLDLNVTDVAEAEAWGARVLETFPGWTVMADPEDGELCLFVRDAPIRARLYEIVVDVGTTPQEAHEMAQWWARVMGGEVGRTDDDGGFSWIGEVPGLPYDGIVFGPVPEPKTVKNRIHWDVTTPDLDALVDAGASIVDRQPRWTVMADPAGNEFCAFEEG